MAQHGGEAAGYYNNTGPPQGGYQMQAPPQAYAGPPADYNNKAGYGGQPGYGGQQGYGEQPPMPPPPGYGQNYQGGPPPQEQPNGNYDGKTFQQQFAVSKPKFHDIPFAIGLILTMLGFTAVSGIAISGYASTKGFNGGGIYDSSNEFGLTTNTIVLFAFVLCVALVLGYGYVWLARKFTKVSAIIS